MIIGLPLLPLGFTVTSLAMLVGSTSLALVEATALTALARVQQSFIILAGLAASLLFARSLLFGGARATVGEP